jgi:hypothetical protein
MSVLQPQSAFLSAVVALFSLKLRQNGRGNFFNGLGGC